MNITERNSATLTLIDTNVLLASIFAKSARHQMAFDTLASLLPSQCIIPVTVLGELFYMTTVRINYQRAVQLFNHTTSTFFIEQLTAQDTTRMQEIMTQYSSAAFDFVDVSLMAIAERLNIRRICTFDRRDFNIFRPTHCDYFELLP
jgi:uncharacterized protein